MSFFRRRAQQHYQAAQTVVRDYIAPVKAVTAPYQTGVAAWAVSAAASSVYSPYAGAAAGAGVTWLGGEGSAYWAETAARGDGIRGEEADAIGDEARRDAYTAGAIGTAVGVGGMIDISQWGILSSETVSFEAALMTAGQNYQTIDGVLNPPGNPPGYDAGDSMEFIEEYGAALHGWELAAAENQAPMEDEEDDEDGKPKRPRRKRRYQVIR